VRTFLLILGRLIRSLALLLISPFVAVFLLVAFAVADLFARIRPLPPSIQVSRRSASVVIPNWNGRDLLEKYLPSVVEAMDGDPANEVIVVDNGSADGSAEFVRSHFPSVRLLALDRNLGFGGGSNAGFQAARNDIVVLLNSDMRVDREFLPPLLEAFTDEQVFAVGCQIFFSDPTKVREETGLTQGWWESGGLRVRHRIDPTVQSAYPCSYPGGGSSAFDRRKFLELGGFDPLLSPFYLEDTDLGYMAWKRGWKVLYEPRSIVFHEHRGTIGKTFSRRHIDLVLKKNFILFCWKNIHQWKMVFSHIFFLFAGAAVSQLFGDSPERSNFAGLWKALLQLPAALRSRVRARGLAAITDTEAFRRPLGGYFRDRFQALPADPERLRVLFLSPYAIWPPVHGGAVFMSQTVKHLARLTQLNLIILLDHAWELEPHRAIQSLVHSTEFLVRLNEKQKTVASIAPHAITEFASQDLEWLIHRQILTQEIDVVQIEYTALAQYAMDFSQIACILFEHDVYFQSVGRQFPKMHGFMQRIKAGYEYLRAFRFELGVLSKFDRIQVCSPANASYLTSFLPALANRIDDNLRAGIDTSQYGFEPGNREPFTMLFLGSFRHTPNQVALKWFTAKVLPRVLQGCPQARLVVVGSEPPPRHSLPELGPSIELRGFVEDVHEPLSRYAVFVCPILSGSGMRVKLLEAFASGIPVVSTGLGAEGLTETDGQICALADDPEAFAAHILGLFQNPLKAAELAGRAHDFVVENKDMQGMTGRLVESYREVVKRKRSVVSSAPKPPLVSNRVSTD
jgi:GT2 family glycosyltransferase/glycosyltransferase involved in cell wall biosynthesis